MMSKEKKRAICIIGMHRSGTSTVARAINLLGVYLGEEYDIMAPANDNPGGFWERDDIVSLHGRMLHQFKRRWDTASPLPQNWYTSSEIKPFKEELISLIKNNFSGHELWAWKDPRTSILLPFWRDVLGEMGIDLLCLLIVRNPLDVANSLQKRNGFPYDKSFGIWFNYNITALQVCLELPHVLMTYDDLLQNWESELKRVAKTLRIPWPDDKTQVIEKINSFISPHLCHSISTLDDLYKRNVPYPVIKCYELLDKFVREPIREDYIPKLCNLFEEYSSYARLFQQDSEELWKRIQEISEKDRQISEKDKQISEKDKQISEKDKQISEKDKQISEKDKQIQSILNSWSWRITAPLRKVWSATTTR